jgi:branched-chain amino acid transport system permease protein
MGVSQVSSKAAKGLPALARRRGRFAWLLPVFVALVLCALQTVLTPYTQGLLLRLMILAIFALSLELLVGTTGLVSFGHAAFFGIGGYMVVLVSPQYAAGSIATLLPISIAAAAVYALAVGALSLRARGVYFIMVTLAFAQMVFFLFYSTDIAGGSDGKYLYFRPTLTIAGNELINLDSQRQLYWFTLALLAFTYGLLALIRHSRFGHALAGIRSHEHRMRAVGFRTYGYKLAAFVIAGALAGMAGFLEVAKNGVVNPSMLSWHTSAEALLMIILGGLGSLRGAVIGTVAFTLLQEFYQSSDLVGPLADHWQLPLGLTIIAFVAFMPKGLIGLFRRLYRRTAS